MKLKSAGKREDTSSAHELKQPGRDFKIKARETTGTVKWHRHTPHPTYKDTQEAEPIHMPGLTTTGDKEYHGQPPPHCK